MKTYSCIGLFLFLVSNCVFAQSDIDSQQDSSKAIITQPENLNTVDSITFKKFCDSINYWGYKLLSEKYRLLLFIKRCLKIWNISHCLEAPENYLRSNQQQPLIIKFIRGSKGIKGIWIFNFSSSDPKFVEKLKQVDTDVDYLCDSMIFCRIMVDHKLPVRQIIKSSNAFVITGNLELKKM